MSNFKSIRELVPDNLLKLTRIEHNDSQGRLMLTKDGKWRKVKLTFYAEGNKLESNWFTMITLSYKVENLELGVHYAIDEREPCVDLSPKEFGVNIGKPRYAIDPMKIDDVRQIMISKPTRDDTAPKVPSVKIEPAPKGKPDFE